MNVVVPVRPGSDERLEAVLRRIGSETRAAMNGKGHSPLVDFDAVISIHYARWVLMPNRSGGQILAFNTWYDGPIGDSRCSEREARTRHLNELVSVARAGLDAVYEHCEGYPGPDAKRDDVVAFFERSCLPTRALYFGSPGRSRDQIRREAELARKTRAWVDAQGERLPSASQVRAAMQAAAGELGRFPAQEKDWAKLARAALAILPLALAVPAAAIVLRHKEKSDVELEPIYSEAERKHTFETTSSEDEFFQNALSNVVDVKPGLFRQALLRVVLFVIDALARGYFVDGKLGSIPSIHAAHWYLLDGGKRLAFVSNYDSSWESYLGDFIDQASSGLTAIWSNTVGYPKTEFLAWAGSRAGDRFKAWSHHIQVTTQVWYAAYPWLSINNVNDNTVIRRGLTDPGVRADEWMGVL